MRGRVRVAQRGFVGRDYRTGEAGAVTDAERERLIESYRTILELSREPDWKRLAAAEMARLIKERSPQQVEQIERERGLRAS